jgi:pimeloyl-ACP methyl ester carboxylesterase
VTQPVLVFLHGGGVGAWMWDEQVAHFSRDFDVRTPTLPGHDPATSTTFTSHADAAARIARDLDRPATVVGFSLGGQTALRLCADRPDLVDRLVVVSSLTRPVSGGSAAARLSAALLPLARRRWFARLQARELHVPDALFERYLETTRSLTATTLRRVLAANFGFTSPTEVDRFDRPTLLVAGDREPHAVRTGLRAMHDRMVQSELVVASGIGHGFSLQDPDRFNAVLEGWLRRTAEG